MAPRLSSPSFFEHLSWLPIRVFMHVCCSARISGIEHVRSAQSNVIVASNHATELDPLMIVSCLPFFSRQLPLIYVVRDKTFYASSQKGLRKLFYGGFFFRMIGGYEVHGGRKNYEEALANHLAAIRDGLSVCIFPVGRLHDLDDYDRARGGVAYMAAKTGLPIVPVSIRGVDRKTTSLDYLMRKPRLSITFGKPLYAEDIFDTSVHTITETSQLQCERAAVALMRKIAALGT